MHHQTDFAARSNQVSMMGTMYSTPSLSTDAAIDMNQPLPNIADAMQYVTKAMTPSADFIVYDGRKFDPVQSSTTLLVTDVDRSRAGFLL